MTPAERAALIERLEKRADQFGLLLIDPPRPHPDAVLCREAAAALADAERERDEWHSRALEREAECEKRARAQWAAEAQVAALKATLQDMIDMMNEMGPYLTYGSGMLAVRAGEVRDRAALAVKGENHG